MMTDRPTVKVNYLLVPQNNEKKYFDTVIPKKFENRAINTKDMGKNVKNMKHSPKKLKSTT